MSKKKPVKDNSIKTADLKYKQAHRWGFKDTYFTLAGKDENNPVIFRSNRADYQFLANKTLPGFRFYAKEMFGLDIFSAGRNKEVEKKIADSTINKKFIEAFKRKFPAKKIFFFRAR